MSGVAPDILTCPWCGSSGEYIGAILDSEAEYAELMQLRRDKIRLRDSAKHHQDMLQKRETELLAVVAKIDELARKCRGK